MKILCGIDDSQSALKEGDEFTIKGVKLLPDGSFTTQCKPGDETTFTAKLTISTDGMNRAQRRSIKNIY
jgi:hypothetical protein